MRVLPTHPAALVVFTLTIALAGPVAAQSAGGAPPPRAADAAALPELPELTTEQRWQRAAVHVTLFAVMLLRDEMQEGRTAADVADDMVEVFAPGWRAASPFEMARAIRFNWHLWPQATFELLEAADDRVRFRLNRPWTGVFRSDGALHGVAAADFDAFLRRFHEGIATRLGMTYRQTGDGDRLDVTITRP